MFAWKVAKGSGTCRGTLVQKVLQRPQRLAWMVGSEGETFASAVRFLVRIDD
jgi:hypothetical protein